MANIRHIEEHEPKFAINYNTLLISFLGVNTKWMWSVLLAFRKHKWRASSG
jgi:hypothetical protein